jgi:hypothetical protein
MHLLYLIVLFLVNKSKDKLEQMSHPKGIRDGYQLEYPNSLPNFYENF